MVDYKRTRSKIEVKKNSGRCFFFLIMNVFMCVKKYKGKK